jgi:3-hydroxyisobutyrate dehydrogenase-like beta-hydroxyacid dehydrogenase
LIGDQVGQASAIKMCYASLTKGLTALCTELLTAAEALNVSEALKREFQHSQPVLLERMQRGLPKMPPKSRRFVGEMEEIARTFSSVGLTPKILEGAADMYRFVGGTPLADRTPEEVDIPDLESLIASLASHLPEI